MKFIVGEIPKDKDFDPTKDGWLSLPSYNFSISYGISFFAPFFFAGLFLAFLYMLLKWLTGEGMFDSPYEFFPALFASLVGIPFIHEIIRYWVCPEKNIEFSIILPNVPSNWIMATFNGIMSRERLLLILGFPLVILSLIPVFICALFGITSPWITIPIIINGFASFSDLAIIYLILANIPKTADMFVNGSDIWYKDKDQIKK